MKNAKELRGGYELIIDALPTGTTILLRPGGHNHGMTKTEHGWVSLSTGAILKPGTVAASLVGSIYFSVATGLPA